MKTLIKALLHHAGYDVAPFPPADWYTLKKELAPIFASRRINCVLDVGAHTGGYGGFLRDIGYTGHIVSFEPVRRNYEKLMRRVEGDPRWRVFEFALGDRDDRAEINVTRGASFSSFLQPNTLCSDYFADLGDVDHKELVLVRRLDTILSECLRGIPDPRIYLKLDTQGWDTNVLIGAAGVLDSVLALQSEISVQSIYSGMTGYLDFLDRMSKLGFKPGAFVPVSRDPDQGIVEFDCIMVRDRLEKGASSVPKARGMMSA